LKPDTDEAYEVAREILNYLHEHPDATDTLEGIAQWWLTPESGERKVQEVEKAVSILVAEGLVLEVRHGGLLPYYRLNRARAKERSHPKENDISS
jgi:hypothetical protein